MPLKLIVFYECAQLYLILRSIYLTYEKDVEYFDIPGRRFTPPRDVLEDPTINTDNQCFCVGECLLAGVLDLSPCQYGEQSADA